MIYPIGEYFEAVGFEKEMGKKKVGHYLAAQIWSQNTA